MLFLLLLSFNLLKNALQWWVTSYGYIYINAQNYFSWFQSLSIPNPKSALGQKVCSVTCRQTDRQKYENRASVSGVFFPFNLWWSGSNPI